MFVQVGYSSCRFGKSSRCSSTNWCQHYYWWYT